KSQAEADAAHRRAAQLAARLDAAPWPQIALAPQDSSLPPAAAELLGLPADAKADRRLLMASLDAAGRAALESALAALESADTPFDLDLRLADGSRLLALHGRRGLAGDGPCLWLEDRSVTARREAALKADAKHLRGIIDGLPVAVWLRDAE